MNFKVLPPAFIRAMLHGTHDDLTPAANARTTEIKATPCPRCSTSLQERLLPIADVFVDDDPLPQVTAHCQTCGYEHSYATGVVYERGDARKVDDEPFTVRVRND